MLSPLQRLVRGRAVAALYSAERLQRRREREQQFREQCNALRERHYSGDTWSVDEIDRIRRQLFRGDMVVPYVLSRPYEWRIDYPGASRVRWPSAQWQRV